jgi:hypothetical protein
VSIHVILMLVSIFSENWQTIEIKYPKWTFLGSN